MPHLAVILSLLFSICWRTFCLIIVVCYQIRCKNFVILFVETYLETERKQQNVMYICFRVTFFFFFSIWFFLVEIRKSRRLFTVNYRI